MLNDLKIYGDLHPLIVSVEPLRPECYKITERPFTWLPFRITYFAEVESSDEQIRYRVTGIPLTQVNIQYSFTKREGGGTEVLFQLNISGFLPGKNILKYMMIKAQDRLMKGIG